MAESFVKQLLEAGAHFGHKASNWNPKMGPYIFGKRNGIHIIDIRETVKGLLLARKFVQQTVAKGDDILFVGTKRQAKNTIQDLCDANDQPYVTERWLGGTLTNFRTIRSRLNRLEELEALMASDEWASYSKKMASQLTRERKKISRNLSGIRNMNKLPGALVVVDVRREYNALAEAKKLGIPSICIIDTDSDPQNADLPIPANDDAIRGIEILLGQIMEAVKVGKTGRAQQEIRDKDKADEKPRRRSARAQFSADPPPAPAADEAAPEAADEAAPEPASPEATPEPAPAAEVVTEAPANDEAATDAS
ncbi:MAG: 30S ribosomal protein S2 [Planctomycetota bacterium]|jgi:small subunit ribosomal protein S2